MKTYIWCGLTLIVLCSATSSRGDFIIAHSGATDPTTEGFGQLTVPPPSTAAPLINDQGNDAWSITGTGQASQVVYTSGPFSPAQNADIANQGFELTLTARPVQALALPYDNLNPVVISGAAVDTGARRFDVQLGLDANGDTVVVLPTSISIGPGGSIYAPGPNYTLVGSGSSYHVYRLVYDPATQLADLIVDGVERLSNYAGHTTNVVDFGLMWGAYSGGQGNFSLVELASTAIPEPSALLLAATGLGVWPLLRRNRRARHNRDVRFQRPQHRG